MSQTQTTQTPVFGLLLFGGPLSGALVRDVRLANELARRGFKVHVWWAMDTAEHPPLDERIIQRWLFSGGRFLAPRLGGWTRAPGEALGRTSTAIFPYRNRVHVLQKRPVVLDTVMVGMLRSVCAGIERDPAVKRFARELDDAGVTHVLPMLSVLAPWIQAARSHLRRPVKYLVTFQGYELYANYARTIGLEDALYGKLREAVAASDYPAIAVSADYRRRVAEDVGVPEEAMVAIPPGVPRPDPLPDREAARQTIASRLKGFRPERPLITYLGRRDAEKGLDLLLYAAALLRRRGLDVQLAICGPTLFGSHYAGVCQQIAENLRCPVLWARRVREDLRTALFAGSDIVAYPSIHREPFGMVAAEAMSHGTPAVVPAYGGVADVVAAEGERGGLTFDVWDSGSLAEQLETLLTDRALWQRLADAGPRLAEHFSVDRLADRVLDHLGLPPKPA